MPLIISKFTNNNNNVLIGLGLGALVFVFRVFFFFVVFVLGLVFVFFLEGEEFGFVPDITVIKTSVKTVDSNL